VSADDNTAEVELADVELLEPVNRQFEMVPRALMRNHDLTPDARSIIFDWLSHSKRWQLRLKEAAALDHMTYERARKAVRCLRDHGFVHFIKRNAGGGKYAYKYVVANRPVMECGIDGCLDCKNRVQKSTDCSATAWPATAWPEGVITGDGTTETTNTGDPEDQNPLLTSVSSVDQGALFAVPDNATGKQPGPDLEAAFTRFWAVYPRRVGKLKARSQWDRAVKAAGGDPETVIAGAAAYAEDPYRMSRPLQYTAHPATWLFQGRWMDDPSTRPSAAPEQRRMTPAEVQQHNQDVLRQYRERNAREREAL